MAPNRLITFIAFFCLAIPIKGSAQAGRDYIYIVGSSTVFPFATVVAERLAAAASYRTPKVESTGSGGGLKLFCDGVGIDFPDVTNSSRRIKQIGKDGLRGQRCHQHHRGQDRL